MEEKIRKFETGATRDTDSQKLDYARALDPAVIRRYVEYLGKHRKQPDGSMRDWDNWKKGIPQDVYLSSLFRHTMDLLLLRYDYNAKDNHGPVDKQELLCAIMFNSMGMLFEDMKEQQPQATFHQEPEVKIDHVYCDLDGVLVDFVGGLHKALSVEYNYFNYPYTYGKWNMLEDIKDWCDNTFTFDEVNDQCTHDFWAELEWIHDGHDIWRLILGHFVTDKIHFLTTPMPNPQSKEGKRAWVKSHIPLMSYRTIVTNAPKKNYATPTSLLIDDKDTNVEEWREAGGIAILIPRPWNRLYKYSDESYKFFRDELNEVLK